MSNPVIFKSLPATFPEQDKHRVPSAASSVAIHIGLLAVLIVIPLLMPQRIEYRQLVALIAPPPPPPPAPPAPVQPEPSKPAAPTVQPVIKVDPGVIVTPTEIPKEIARIVDEAPAPGVPGGISTGVAGGALRGLLLAAVHTSEPVAAPPPPPPPPPPPAPVITPQAPIRVGGMVKEPSVVKVVPPVYPKIAMKARVTGTVVLEATVTAEGTVDEIKVISGHPLLIPSAIECVKQWRYEPTYLNGQPVAVLLNAKVHFELGPVS